MKIHTIFILLIVSLLLVNCKDKDIPKPLADFQFLVEGPQVTFNGTIVNAETIHWDFGDGNTSTEEDPVHIYSSAGMYTVVMTAGGGNDTFSETKEVTILPSLELLLTGGPARPEGKSWRLKKAYTAGKEGAGPVSNGLGILLPAFDNLLDAVGLGASYEDVFTFVHDGRYIVNNKDGESLMGLVYASVFEASNIRAVSADANNVPLANVLYTPATGTTWEISKDDFTVDAATGPVDFTGRTRLILGEYLGFKDAKTLVILKNITETTMNVALGIHTEPAVIDKPTLLFHLSLEAL